jgi:hypothetical protein
MRDCWELARAGKEKIDAITDRFLAKKLDIRKCYLWTKRLKHILDPTYAPSDKDAKRPSEIFLEF